MALPVLQSLLTLGLVVAASASWPGGSGTSACSSTRAPAATRASPTTAERTRTMLAFTLGQKRLKEDPAAGLLHGVFLYGFLVLGLGTSRCSWRA